MSAAIGMGAGTASLALASSSASPDPAPALALRAASLAATCTACHGAEGRAVTDPAVPGLAGRDADALEAQLLAFKRGERAGSVMPQIAKGYDDEQLRAVARYFAAQPETVGGPTRPGPSARRAVTAASGPTSGTPR